MNKEIEARFLDIDKQGLIQRLAIEGAIDRGEVMLAETIFYDQENKWPDEGRFVRLRSTEREAKLTYKHIKSQTIDGAREIEFTVPDAKLAEQFLENIGLVAFRHQEKKRHTFVKDEVIIDIDTWPKIPVYVEFEGPSEKAIKALAESLGFDWADAVFNDARTIIQDRYNIPVGSLQWFTFDRIE